MANFTDETRARLSRLERGMGLIGNLFAAMGNFYRVGIFWQEKRPTLAFIVTKSYNPKTRTAVLMAFDEGWAEGIHHASNVQEWVRDPMKAEDDQAPKGGKFEFIGEDFASDLINLFAKEPEAVPDEGNSQVAA